MSSGLLRLDEPGVFLRGKFSSHYLIYLILAPVFSQFGQHLDPSTPVVLAQPLSVVLQFTLVAIAGVSWISYQPTAQWSRTGQAFFVMVIATWLLASVSTMWHESLLNPTLVLLPVSLVMILLKPPPLHEVRIAANVFAWALVAIAAIAQMLDELGVRPLHYEGWNRTWIRIWDTFPVLFNLIDYGSRWEGPFGNVNYAGPIGAFLVIFGLIQRRVSGSLLTATGVLFLFVSDSRSAWMAALIAVLVLFSASQVRRNDRKLVTIVCGGAAVLLFAIFVLAIVQDASSTGRRLFWAAYVDQWMSDPLTGVGEKGINELIADMRLPAMATHGHNLIIDPLLRYGLLATLAIAGCGILASLVAWRADPIVRPASLALVALFLGLGVAEDLVSWTYLSISVIPLLFVVMIGDRRLPKLSWSSE